MKVNGKDYTIVWLVVDLPLWKMMEFVSWDDDIPIYEMENKIPWFQTTNQYIVVT